MASEFDTEPNYTDDDAPAPEAVSADGRDDRGLWATLALLLLAAIVLLLLLTQFTARVPNTVGLSRPDAEAKLTRAGFPVGQVSETPLGSGTPGHVYEQAPRAGTMVRKGTGVDLVVALGSGLVRVPDVLGHRAANANIELMQAGLEVANAEEYSNVVPVGLVVSESPQAGSRAETGSTVTVYYSLGPQSAAVVAVSPSNTNDGLTDETRGSTGSGTKLIMNCTTAYPGASAWSSGGDIYVRLSPGGSARRVTSTGDWDTSPVIAPSHKYLVFLRAPHSGAKATAVGAVCFTTFETHMLAMPETTVAPSTSRYYGPPIFAPSEHSTTPDTDWMVFPQYWYETRGASAAPSARLLVCNVPMNSTWVSWNYRLRPAHTLALSPSGKAGCVRIKQTSGSKTLFVRDFNATTGLYLH
jgi:hypothetical protein